MVGSSNSGVIVGYSFLAYGASTSFNNIRNIANTELRIIISNVLVYNKFKALSPSYCVVLQAFPSVLANHN
jgi:hypothetical protein